MTAREWMARNGYRQITTGELAGLWWRMRDSDVAAIRADGNVHRFGHLKTLRQSEIDETIDRALVAA